MKVIVISGSAGHGKDTFAKFLEKLLSENGKSVLITHYGDLLKYICRTFFGWNGEKDEKGRTLLQHVGTEQVRSRKPDYWVSFVADILSLFHDKWDYVLIPDARFPNEINYLKEKGFDVIHVRVVRPGYSILTPEQSRHLSETALNGVKEDYTVMNDLGYEKLKNEAKKLQKLI